MTHSTSSILRALEQPESGNSRSEGELPERSEPTLQPSGDSELQALLRACLAPADSKIPNL